MNPPAGTSGSSRYIQYHPGGGHHGDLPYHKLSSPENGISRIYIDGSNTNYIVHQYKLLI